MRVVVIPADRTGCGYYRLIWPAQAVSLVRPDWTVEIRPPETVQAGFRGSELVGIRGLDPAPDLLVMQRVGTPGQLAVMEWAQAQGSRVVVDFDDAMWCIDPENSAHASWTRSNPFGQNWQICDVAASKADIVTVTTEALERRYGRKHHRTAIVPNCVPQAAIDLPGKDRADEGFYAGWSGFTGTHPRDCEISAPAAHAVLETGGHLRVIADAKGAAKEWGIDPDLVDSVPPQKLGPDYYKEMSGLDLMLVGLRDTPFNRAKSSLKVLEAATAGVPSIAPDNAPHRALAKTGFPVMLASNPSEWADIAKQYVSRGEDYHLAWRAEQEHHIREHTIEGNAERWAQAWERAAKR